MSANSMTWDGDLPGHAFHGNQYKHTQEGADGAARSLSDKYNGIYSSRTPGMMDAVNATRRAQGESSTVLHYGPHDSGSSRGMVDNMSAAKLHEKAAKVNDKAGMVAHAIGHREIANLHLELHDPLAASSRRMSKEAKGIAEQQTKMMDEKKSGVAALMSYAAHQAALKSAGGKGMEKTAKAHDDAAKAHEEAATWHWQSPITKNAHLNLMVRHEEIASLYRKSAKHTTHDSKEEIMRNSMTDIVQLPSITEDANPEGINQYTVGKKGGGSALGDKHRKEALKQAESAAAAISNGHHGTAANHLHFHSVYMKKAQQADAAENKTHKATVIGIAEDGDLPGHEFHGNQHTGGKGLGSSKEAVKLAEHHAAMAIYHEAAKSVSHPMEHTEAATAHNTASGFWMSNATTRAEGGKANVQGGLNLSREAFAKSGKADGSMFASMTPSGAAEKSYMAIPHETRMGAANGYWHGGMMIAASRNEGRDHVESAKMHAGMLHD